MAIQQHKIAVQKDHLRTLSRSRPVPAMAELIWNALDADATEVHVYTTHGETGLFEIVVRDNGHGIPHKDARDLFTKLGGSWKASTPTSRGKGRILHGKEGKGRFRALSLGRVAEWKSFFKEDGRFYEFTIEMFGDQLDSVRISDPKESSSDTTGVTLTISEPEQQWQVFDNGDADRELEELLAIYLSDYPGINVEINGRRLDPSTQIKEVHNFDLSPITTRDSKHSVSLRIIEWKAARSRLLYLCDSSGFSFHRFDSKFHTGPFHFSAYLRTDYIKRFVRENTIELVEMDAEISRIRNDAVDQIKSTAKEAHAQRANNLVSNWKQENVYPYTGQAGDPIEEAERQVFDIVAVSLHEHIPEFDSSPQKSKAFQFRMLRQAIERSPDELQTIITEVLQLPAKQQKELADLLRETTLTAMINATRVITDRLKFLRGLETLVFNEPHKSRTKERAQLHRLLAANSWIFGERFNLTADDQSLTEVLRKHLKLANRNVPVNEPVKRYDGRTGIIDLMLSRALTNGRPKQRDHLVVELKAPKVPISQKEITQIESYAFAVSEDERFHGLDTDWTFMIISSDLDGYASKRARQTNLPPGCIHQSTDGTNIAIYARTWSELIDENKARLAFYKDQLEHSVSSEESIMHLRERYSEILLMEDLEVEDSNIEDGQKLKPESA